VRCCPTISVDEYFKNRKGVLDIWRIFKEIYTFMMIYDARVLKIAKKLRDIIYGRSWSTIPINNYGTHFPFVFFCAIK
jgi:hypothetical protein